jgi:hypothetical protein
VTPAQLARELRQTRRLRHLTTQCIDLAAELRRGGGRWAGGMEHAARQLLLAVDYFEQDQRRAAAEVLRPDEPTAFVEQPALPPARDEEASQ